MAVLRRLKPSAGCFIQLKAAGPPLLHLVRLAFNKPYHTSSTSAIPAAAQPLMDPDHHYYYDNEAEDDSRPSLDRVNSPYSKQSQNAELDRWGPQRGVQWSFIGGYNFKGRYLYSERLSKLLEVPHISITSLVRQDLSPRSSLYKQIANAVNRGTLVPEDIIFRLLAKRLEDGYYRGETGFILDGIPRTQVQAEILDQFVDIDLVVNFKCMENHLVENYGNSILPQNKPLEDYYKKQKKLLTVPVRSAPGETWQELLAALHLQHMNAVHPKLPSGPSWL